MQKFQSAKDLMSYLLIGLPLVVTVVLSVVSFIEGEWAPLIILIIPNALILSIWFSTYYEFKEDMLRVQSGPFSWDIRYANIQSVRRSRSVLSAPALALKRIEIKYHLGTVLISPKQEREFLSALQDKNPNIRIDM